MTLADEIIKLRSGSPELETVRATAVSGDPVALKKYLYFCALRNIRADRFIPPKKKLAMFRKMVDADVVEVSLG